GSTTYTIVVTATGSGSGTARVTDNFSSPGFGAVTWTCAASSGSSCAASGTGKISDDVTLQAGGTLTYTAVAQIVSDTTGSLTDTATVAACGISSDATPADNTDSDTDTLVPTGDLSITKTDGKTTFFSGGISVYSIVVSN